jgi:hypothetical protein
LTFIALEATLSEPFLPFGIPFDFVLFAVTLLGIAIFKSPTIQTTLLTTLLIAAMIAGAVLAWSIF